MVTGDINDIKLEIFLEDLNKLHILDTLLFFEKSNVPTIRSYSTEIIDRLAPPV